MRIDIITPAFNVAPHIGDTAPLGPGPDGSILVDDDRG